jgi:hypothetical protein
LRCGPTISQPTTPRSALRAKGMSPDPSAIKSMRYVYYKLLLKLSKLHSAGCHARGSTVFDPEAQTRRELAEVGFAWACLQPTGVRGREDWSRRRIGQKKDAALCVRLQELDFTLFSSGGQHGMADRGTNGGSRRLDRPYTNWEHQSRSTRQWNLL